MADVDQAALVKVDLRVEGKTAEAIAGPHPEDFSAVCRVGKAKRAHQPR